MTEFVTPLQKAREKRGLSQEQVASILGVSQPTISRLERARDRRQAGGKGPNPELVAKLARLFNREGLSEMHVLFPHRYTRWRPA